VKIVYNREEAFTGHVHRHPARIWCEHRATRDGRLGDYQMVQEQIADSYIQLTQFRLMVLHVAWLIDKHKDYRKVRHDIAAVKVRMPEVLHNIVQRSIQGIGRLRESMVQSASVMRFGVESSGSFGASTEIGDASSVTRAAGDESVIGYGIIPGCAISPWPYCTTIVPPWLTHSKSRGFCAASDGSDS